MDKRTFLALLLTALVIVVTPMLFRSGSRAPTRPIAAGPRADSGLPVAAPPAAAPVSSAPTTPATAGAISPSINTPSAGSRATVAETTTVTHGKATYAFANPGAEPLLVRLDGYRSLRSGAAGPVRLENPSIVQGQTIVTLPLLRYRLALGGDTIAFDTIPFRVQ